MAVGTFSIWQLAHFRYVSWRILDQTFTKKSFYARVCCVKKEYSLDDNTGALGKIFSSHGWQLYLVGGAVRDYILGIPNDDYDYATDASPEEVMAMFPHHCIPTGLQHGTVTVRFRKQSYEVTTFRSEGDYSDGRHPDSVEFVRSLESDLERRDFTINAFAASCTDGHIIDMHGGYEDLENHTIRAIGNPHERFGEDALRMIRACRFASKLDFSIEDETFNAIKEKAGTILKVSQERIKEELFKIIGGPHPVKGIELMRKTGLLHYILPELERCTGVEQAGFHTLDVYAHTLRALDYAAKKGFGLYVRLAVLFHDIAKPECRRESSGEGRRYTFFGHDRAGAAMSEEIMKRLKCSNKEIETVSRLVAEHMFNYSPSWTDGALRRFIRRVGEDSLEMLFEVRQCDQSAIDNLDPSLDTLSQLKARVKAELEKKNALSIKDLAVGGNDLIALGVKKGPDMGRTLSYLLDAVLEDPSLNEKDKLSRLALSVQDSLSHTEGE